MENQGKKTIWQKVNGLLQDGAKHNNLWFLLTLILLYLNFEDTPTMLFI